MARLQGAIAATRFGMGARPGEIADAASDPRGWLKAQIAPNAAMMPAGDLLSAKEVLEARQEAYGMTPAAKGQDGVSAEARQGSQKQVQREIRDGLQEEIEARGRHAAATPNAFAERWHRFWANHFTVAARNAQVVGLVGPFEREAIRPNVFSSFSKLLGAATFHPGMLVYLDAARSIGPSTQVAERRDAGLNENLAREILELHTMGVGSGYTQADIVEFAKALTGWTVAGPQTARLVGLRGQNQRTKGGQQRARQQAAERLTRDSGETVFLEPLHEPGPRKVLSKTYSGPGADQAAAILDDLAANRATAQHVATKLARHFVSDTPPASAIAKLEAAYMKSGGDLSVLARAVIDLDEAWGETPLKFKTPEELLVSAARAAGAQATFGGAPRAVYTSLAQQPFGAPSPAGWPDDTASWAGSDAIKKRLEWANSVSRRMARGETPTQFLDRALGEIASEKTRQAVARAESAEQGFTLALMSPEFQRR
ncbi:MAG TPA: DUF1800 family protein [Hyphomonadaceae bacterium]|mgnify:CR=1 FL=1|nr:DUF1800 family protein [Hyphomonadaceae bacterium]HPI48021.1 DUF1800 family protein [Hyphomonadaceae bacterium]